MKKIIFICKYNAFRSRVAEEYFKKVNKNKNVEIISRGLIVGGKPSSMQVKLAKEILGINIANKKSKPIDVMKLINSDKIIIVANDIPRIIFNYPLIKDKVIIWKIKDELYNNRENIKRIILSIKKKVDKLNQELENGKKF